MQRTHDEQRSNENEMIKQVALLTEMMKGIQEDRARSDMNENREEADGVTEAKEKEPADVEDKSDVLRKGIETVEVEPDGKEILAEEELITTSPDDDALQKILEEAQDEPPEKEVKVIKRDVELDNTLFYLQSEEMHVLDEKVEEFTTAVEGDNTPAERPPQTINQSEGCCYEEEDEPELKEGRSRRKAARSI